MKSPRALYLASAASLILGCAVLPLWAGGSVNAKAPDAAKGKGGTNVAPAELPVPVAVFDVTQPPTKDPFFPNSSRRPVTQQGKNQPAPAVSASSFVLMALSGPSYSRLAMINHRTLGVGEAVELALPNAAKAKIRVVQIKEDSVIIRVISPAQPDLIELVLGGGKNKGVYIGVNDVSHAAPSQSQ